MCTESEKVTAYLDGELVALEQSAYETHLGSCVECQSDLKVLRDGLSLLKALPSIEPSANLRRQVLTGLPPQPAGFWSRFGLAWSAPLGGLAAAVAVVGLVVATWPHRPAVDPNRGRAEFELAANLDLMENLTVVESSNLTDEELDAVEHLDELEAGE
jgi:anti-sigma factor RsiW